MVDPVNTDPIFMTVKALAERNGVSQAAISKMVRKLVASHGLEVRRNPNGSVAGVNHVHFDRLRGTFGDSAQQRLPMPAASQEPITPNGDTLDGARLLKLRIDTEAARLAHNEELRKLIRRDTLEAALVRIAEEIGRTVDLPQYADKIAAAMQRKGLHGLRLELKALTHQIRTDVSNICAGLVLAAPVLDEPLGETEAA